jgi:hypothetical protein
VWWYVTNTFYALSSAYIFLFVLSSISFTCFIDTITDLIEHDYIFRQLYICHISRTFEVRGLVDTDASLDKCLEEASKWQMPYSLRKLFAIIMVIC